MASRGRPAKGRTVRGVRLHPDVAGAAQAVLRDGESLTDFVETAVVSESTRRRMSEYDVEEVERRRRQLAERGIVCEPPQHVVKGVSPLSRADRETLASIANCAALDRTHESRIANTALTAAWYATDLGEYWPLGAKGAVRAGMDLAVDWRSR